MMKIKSRPKLSGYIYFKPLTKPQLAAAPRRPITDLTPNKLYKILRLDTYSATILDDIEFKITVRLYRPCAHLGCVGIFRKATKHTLFKATRGYNGLSVQLATYIIYLCSCSNRYSFRCSFLTL